MLIKKNIEEKIIILNDEIIHELYELYESNNYISAVHLIKKDFKWNIHSGEIQIDGIKTKKLIRYAYTLFTNQTIKIWKL